MSFHRKSYEILIKKLQSQNIFFLNETYMDELECVSISWQL